MISLFISKNKIDVSQNLISFCESQKINLLTHSFLEFYPVPFEVKKEADILFFGSKRAFDFYMQSATISSHQSIACIGSVTKKHIEKAGFFVFFAGEQAGNAPEVAQELKMQIGTKSLLVLRSNKSFRSIPKAFSPEQCEEKIVYETRITAHKLSEKPAILIFTSPSNAEAYLLENKIDKTQKVIAWGESTKTYLEENKCPVFTTLKTATEEELIQVIQNNMQI